MGAASSDFKLRRFQVLIRLGVMLPVLLVVVGLVWYVLRKRGVVTSAVPPNPADMRTWPLGLALADAAAFALTFAIVTAWMGEGDWTAAVAGAASAIVAVGIFPRLVARFA